MLVNKVKEQLNVLTSEWIERKILRQNDLFIIGCSTSEVTGEPIGTKGNEALAKQIFFALKDLQTKTNIHLVFQCCEHLNRALVMEREVANIYQLEQVSVIPTPEAGGAMAAVAYQELADPVVVEYVQAHAGMDIGETMIGMHLRHVAVPVRLQQNYIGHARVTGARTRPKLIGGKRARYE